MWGDCGCSRFVCVCVVTSKGEGNACGRVCVGVGGRLQRAVLDADTFVVETAILMYTLWRQQYPARFLTTSLRKLNA